MKTFEEKWTAWLDGELKEPELAAFEAALPDRAAAEAERQQARQLGGLLREHLAAAPMQNADFFSHQVHNRIAAAAPSAKPARTFAGWWSFGRVAWTGAAVAAALTLTSLFLFREQPAADQSGYLSQILSARVDHDTNPDATVTIFQAKDEKATVLWVEGLESLPSEYAAR